MITHCAENYDNTWLVASCFHRKNCSVLILILKLEYLNIRKTLQKFLIIMFMPMNISISYKEIFMFFSGKQTKSII